MMKRYKKERGEIPRLDHEGFRPYRLRDYFHVPIQNNADFIILLQGKPKREEIVKRFKMQPIVAEFKERKITNKR